MTSNGWPALIGLPSISELTAIGSAVAGEDVEEELLALAFERGHAEHLARLRRRRHVVELAAGADVAGLEDRAGRRSRCADPRAGRASSRTTVAASPSIDDTICASPPSPGTNDATSRPSRSTVHMSQCARTSARRCEMNSTERLRSFHCRITSNTRSERSGGRAAVISSSSSSCGSNASARARSSMRRNGSGTSRTCSSRSSPSRSIVGELRAHRARCRRRSGAGSRRR